jgi:hypothetical protein
MMMLTMLAKFHLSSIAPIMVLVLLLPLLMPLALSDAQLTEIVYEPDDRPRLHDIINNNNNNKPELDSLDEQPCHVDYQVMKRYVGRCSKIGQNTKVCIAGNYIHPFHPACL